MNFYVDDDSTSSALVRLLNQAGHDVQLPIDIGMAGSPDAVHLTTSVREGRVLLTGNYDDFEDLHDLILQAKGHHPGIFVVRRDNDPRRDMSPRGIASAIAKLLAAGIPLADQFIILNHWR